jgi:hypothetical protein
MANVFSVAALLIALLSLLYAWRLHAELDRVTSRLDRYNKALFAAGEELRQVSERLAQLGGTSRTHEGREARTPNITLDFER